MILVAGSANLDFTVPVPHIPRPGETVLGGDTRLAPGGKGANQAVAAARAGAHVAFLGALGQDAPADILLHSLHDSGVDTQHVKRVNGPSGAAYINVTPGGENAITVAPGANAHLTPHDLPDLTGVTHLLLQLEIPLTTVRAYARAARTANVTVTLNAAPAQPLDDDLLAHTDILIVNERELRQVQNLPEHASTTDELTTQLQARGPRTVIVTLGANGSYARHDQHAHHQAAHPVNVVDTTGAGDTFTGVLSAWLASGATLPEALHAATVGAALACTRSGAQPSMPRRADILHALGHDAENPLVP